LHTPKYKARVSIKEKSNSGPKFKLEIKSEGSKLTKRTAKIAMFFEDILDVILYVKTKISKKIIK
jgi:hypothetical protein